MLIQSNGDAARRIGVASLKLKDWLKSDPKMEDIVLERDTSSLDLLICAKVLRVRRSRE
jgi:hypothetical protein